MKILVVEDEPKLHEALVEGLRQRGNTIDSAFDGLQAERLARLNDYDAVILDIMLPGQDGLTVCQHLREAHVLTPILFLTAKDAIADRVSGLDQGGDDYLIKPFSFDELLARLRALTRRPPLTSTDILKLDELELDTRSQKVRVGGKDISLTLREYGVLEYLLRHSGEAISREDILSHVWDQFYDSFSNVVDVHLKNLRKKLPPAYAKRIHTVWGKGYRLA